jgi:GNAT superfamily N-acetyltransferase
MTLRAARIDDLEQLYPLAVEFYSQSQFLRNFDLTHFTRTWSELIGRQTGEIFLLTDDAGEIAGTLGAVAYPDVNSGELIATEFFWYVKDGLRGGGMKLYRAFEAWARERGCTQIRMVHLLDSMPQKLARVYAHLGFVPAEVHYTKELSS